MNITQIAKRMTHIQPFEVMEIQSLARQLETAGHDVIHMEIGEPDFPTPRPIIEAAKRALDGKPINYTSACGMMALREAIAAHYLQRFNVHIDPARIIVTAGSSAALLLAFGTLLNAGDEVLMADPGYPCNRHFVRTFDGEPVCIPVNADSAYQIDATMVEQHWTPRTRATLIASPANPTGTTVPLDELKRIAAVTCKRGGILIVDEIYQGLTYDHNPVTALQMEDDETCENLIVVNSFSKYFQMTGWRLGWLVVPTQMARAVEILAQNLFISPSATAQYAALAAFDAEAISILEARRAQLCLRRNFLLQQLPRLGFKIPVVPQGAFYIYADSTAVAADSFSLSRQILQHAHIALTPGRDFGTHRPEAHIRIAYTQPIARLESAISRLRTFLEAHK